jgi:outer membrane protein assembly factor BamB
MWINNSDTILFFQNRGIYDAKGFAGRVDLYAYNLSRSRVEWKIDSIEDVSCLPSKSRLYNGNLYFCGMRNIYCLNPKTGEIIWKWWSNEKNAVMPTSNWFFYENKIFVKPLCGLTYALNADNGLTLWSVRQGYGTNALNMASYKGKLYQSNWGDAVINIIDIDSGLEINKLKVDSANPLAIDPLQGTMYFHDYVRLNCYKLSAN